MNLSLHNIHLLALVHVEDLKKYTADAVMCTVVAELEDLHNVGFTVEVNGQKQHFRCFLTQVVGDNLGLHSVLGFAENFSRATYACDLCMATQEDMQTNFSDSETLARTPQLYDMHVRQLEQGVITVTGCGIKRPSALAIIQQLMMQQMSCTISLKVFYD